MPLSATDFHAALCCTVPATCKASWVIENRTPRLVGKRLSFKRSKQVLLVSLHVSACIAKLLFITLAIERLPQGDQFFTLVGRI